MKFTVQLRMKNPGPTKYLINSVDRDTFQEAFREASKIADESGPEYFVEIRNEVGEKLAGFNEARTA